MKEIVIYGAGGVGRGAAQIVRDINRYVPTYNILGYLDDDESTHGQEFNSLAVVGGSQWLLQNPDIGVVIAFADPEAKERLVAKLAAQGCTEFITLVHPRAWVADDVIIGEGSIIYALACVNANARMGRFVLLNMNSTTGHDAVLGDYVTLAPGARVLGAAKLHAKAELGSNSVVLPGIEVGSGAMLGAGAVATKNIAPHSVVVGIPAAAIRTSQPKEE